MTSSYKILIGLTALITACTSVRDSPKYQLGDGKYRFRQPGEKYKTVNVYVKDDSAHIYLINESFTPLLPKSGQSQYFLKRSFDLDVVTVLFKYRPSAASFPRQLTTDFNGQVFVGYRMDRFGFDFKKTPMGSKKIHYHRAISVGGFGGFGTSSITPWTTNYQTTDEYNGFILSRGLALMIGVNQLTVGLGVGWDYLTDRDKQIWIYQNKPWYGLTLGLNLN
jgi:hypothetical protein